MADILVSISLCLTGIILVIYSFIMVREFFRMGDTFLGCIFGLVFLLLTVCLVSYPFLSGV